MLHETVVLDDVSRVTDRELIADLRRLVRADQVLNARLLVHLGEVDARGLYREHAYPSMFVYCVEELRMSEAQAYSRIQAARLSRQFPRILELVAQGALNLSGIKLLAPHLTADNHLALLEQAQGKGKREVELLVAAIAPKPDVPNRIRKLPEPSSSPVARPSVQSTLQAQFALDHVVSRSPLAASQTPRDASPTPRDASPPPRDASQTPRGASQTPPDASPPPCDASLPANAMRSVREANHPPFVLEAPRLRGSSTPLSPGRYKVEFTAGQALHDKLGQLKDLLRHQVPDGELAVLIERAVDLLIDHCMKRRFAQTRTPETRSAVKSSRAQPHPTNASTSQPHAANSGATQPHTARSSAGQSKTASPHRADNACVGVCGLTDAARLAEGSVVRSSSASSSRYIPRAVVREVHQRDAGQCTFISADGKRCAERGFLELHHHELPYARGGEATIENLRLVCRAHNALFAERDFGRTWMRSKRTQRGSSSANSVQNR